MGGGVGVVARDTRGDGGSYTETDRKDPVWPFSVYPPG